MLGLLNDAYGDARTIILNLRDFIASHPEMREEIEEFKLYELLNQASELEREIDDVMMRIKKEVEERSRA
jgi:hypothetical protein